jgi:hypothetical protein
MVVDSDIEVFQFIIPKFLHDRFKQRDARMARGQTIHLSQLAGRMLMK